MDFILSLRLECERTKERERKTHEEREEICPGRPRCSCSIVRSSLDFFWLFFFIIYTKYRTIERREKKEKEEEEEEQVFLS